MHRDSSKRLTGNDVFEGYAIDLVKEIAEILSEFSLLPLVQKKRMLVRLNSSSYLLPEFNYTFKWVADQNYGKRNRETSEWNGMMGELLAQVRGD